MKQQEAERLLNDTFNNEFNPSRYTHFLSELLKGKLVIHDKSLGVNKEFEEYIKSFKKIGEYKHGRNNIEVFAVELKRVSSLERARTMQRNFVAKWLHNEFLPKDAGLVAFYGDNPEDWRFSFVKMEYKLGEDGKVLKELTPAKRYSFLVGKNEPNHTCKRQFLKLLTEEDIPPTLEELERAFSVENVTKEFFEEYKNRFFELRESIEKVIEKNPVVKKEFENKNINPTEFAKKLLGQIVFLYFLQKKGWLGVRRDSDGKFNDWGTGPKDFMKKLFSKEIVNYDNFFNDVLEPLFYQALANDRSADNDYYEKLKCKVPFLNGGLFEPIKDYDWTKTDILLDNSVFKDIFSTFDQFNFTIKEDEPLEREVAVDPEMLGKVFENLLDVNDRKSKGAFYTPREIVHYMCQQSLINYLETNTSQLGIKREDIELFILKGDIALDRLRRANIGRASAEDIRLILPKTISSNYKELDRLLREIKICDPAVGSGAFPVGMMNEIVRARNILSYFFLPSEKAERTDYNLKRQTIENSLYGVDIESSAVEITKLRFWLSLIVDELDMKNIRPLPNLDNRIMCGNSLIEEFEGIKLFDENIANDKIAKQMTLFKKGSEYKLKTLQKLQADYFNEQDRNKKKKLMKDIENLEWEFIEATLKEENNEEALKKLEQYKTSKSKPFFFWKLYFSDVFKRDNPGFDVVIGNPPYVGEKGHSSIFEEIKNGALGKFHQRKVDLFYFFFHLGLNLLRMNASFAMITTNYYITSYGGTKLRVDLKERAIIKELINFNELRIFDSALGQHNMITIFTKGNSSNSLCKCTFVKSAFEIKEISKVLQINDKTKDISLEFIAQKDLYETDKNYIRMHREDGNTNNLLKKISLNNIRMDRDFRVNQGIITSADKVTKKHLEKFKDLLSKDISAGDGIFVISKKEYEKLSKNKKEKDRLIPIYKNSDIKRWWCSNNVSKYFINLSCPADKDIPLKDFPNIANHLNKFKPILESRTLNCNGLDKIIKRGVWWLIAQGRQLDFSKPKIVCPQRSERNTFGFNNTLWSATSDVFFITSLEKMGLNLKYLLGLLNSKLYFFWFSYNGKRKGNYLELIGKPLAETPIKEVPLEQQKTVIEIVDKILSITETKDYTKNADKQAMVKAYEKKIDKLVYDLYELTPEEIKIVEEFGK
jgi:hypothetical protein